MLEIYAESNKSSVPPGFDTTRLQYAYNMVNWEGMAWELKMLSEVSEGCGNILFYINTNS